MNGEPTPLSPETLSLNDPPRLAWLRVRDAVGLLWPGNPKLHDIDSLIESIDRHGFQELPKYDATLSAIKAGNGRIEALAAMQERGTYDLPRGCALDGEGRWCLPVLFGTDAHSEAAARAYAVDSNNLTLMGGDFSGEDLARLYDPDGYAEILRAMQADDTFAVSVNEQDLERLLHQAAGTWSYTDAEQSEDAFPAQYGVIVLCQSEAHQAAVYNQLKEAGHSCRVVVT